jgi:hypothetical protein
MGFRGHAMLVRLFFAAAALSAFTGAALAQAPGAEEGKLVVSGSVRARFETIEGQARTGFNSADDLWNFRTRLAAEYREGSIRIGGEVYDSRAYGANAGTPLSTNEVNTLELVQAYVARDFAGPFEGAKSSVQAGRMTLNLGSRRFVAADDFRNTTNGYTGLKADLTFKGGASVTGIYVLPQIRLPATVNALQDNVVRFDRETGALQLRGGVATVPFGLQKAALQASFFNLLEADQADMPSRNRHLNTTALRYFRTPAKGAFDFDVEGAVQTGATRTSTAQNAAWQDVYATFAHVSAGYKWNAPAAPRLALDYDYVSGDKPGGRNSRFDTLFGMRRAELAPAGLYNAVGRANLSSPGVRIEIEPSPRWDAFAGYRALYLASASDAFSTTGVRDPAGASGKFAGQQFDARVRYWLAPQKLRLESNFTYLAKGGFLKRAPNAPAGGDTKYLVLDLTASF